MGAVDMGWLVSFCLIIDYFLNFSRDNIPDEVSYFHFGRHGKPFAEIPLGNSKSRAWLTSISEQTDSGTIFGNLVCEEN
jgi:hypothetical protein